MAEGNTRVILQKVNKEILGGLVRKGVATLVGALRRMLVQESRRGVWEACHAQENPQASGFALLVSYSVEGRRKYFLVLADQLLSRKVYSANNAMDSSNMYLNGTIRYEKSFENRYRLVNKH